MRFETILTTLSDVVWGPPMLVLLVGTGVFLTLRLRGLQFTTLVPSLRLALIVRDEPGGTGDVSHYQALMTALAATVGTGNIAGVATAIAAGGPGALFWMWMTGLVGMATKFAEAVLAVKYRVTDDRHAMAGGPMYYIERGLGWRWLGIVFAGLTAVAAFGIGNLVGHGRRPHDASFFNRAAGHLGRCDRRAGSGAVRLLDDTRLELLRREGPRVFGGQHAVHPPLSYGLGGRDVCRRRHEPPGRLGRR